MAVLLGGMTMAGMGVTMTDGVWVWLSVCCRWSKIPMTEFFGLKGFGRNTGKITLDLKGNRE